MTIRSNAQRLPFPIWPAAALMMVASVAVIYAALMVFIVVTMNRSAPRIIASAPQIAKPEPTKFAVFMPPVQPVAPPSPLRVEWSTGRFDGEHPRLSGGINYLEIESDGTKVAAEYGATWISKDNGETWQQRPQTDLERKEAGLTTSGTNSRRSGETIQPDSKTGAWPRWIATFENGSWRAKAITEHRLVYPAPAKNMEGADNKFHFSLFVSRDEGATWNEVILPPEVGASAVALEPYAGGVRLYISAGKKVWQTNVK